MSWINIESHKDDGDVEKSYQFARWISWLFLVASILLLTYTYYRAEINFQGTKGVFYFKYYLISLAGILFWGGVLRLRAGIRANIVTVATSLIVSLYLIEGGLTLFGVAPTNFERISLAHKQGVDFDQRTRLQVIEELIADGVDAVPTFHPTEILDKVGVYEIVMDVLPFSGVANKTTVYGNESVSYTHLTLPTIYSV